MMALAASPFALVAAAQLFTGCRSVPPPKPLQRFEFTTPEMGALFKITLYAPDKTTAHDAADAAFSRVAELNSVMSDYEADSELMQLIQKPAGEPARVSADLFDVLQRAQQISELTGGAFDVTVGPYVRLWRFARRKEQLPTPPEIAAAAASVGWKKLELNPRERTVTLAAPNMRLDLGGIGKGYAADQALAVLKGRGLNRALVAASGDLAVGDPPPGQKGWKVGIAAPGAPPGELITVLLLRNAGVSTSGDTELFVEIAGVRYSHVVNPRTGLGLTERIQATVIARDATTSDSLATAVSILGAERGLKLIDSLPDTSALIVAQEGNRKHTLTSLRFKKIPRRKIPQPD